MTTTLPLRRRDLIMGTLALGATAVCSNSAGAAADGVSPFLSLSDLASQMRSRSLSPVDVTEQIIGRIQKYDPWLKSYATVAFEQAREQARVAERDAARGNWHGTLHGVPIAVKDNFFTKDIATENGGIALRGNKPPFDAPAVARLRSEGAIIIGKLAMLEGAHADNAHVAHPLNPWNPDYWCGGSSSGSGAATAAGLCYGALGSDTGGSVRLPAALCGLAAITPTYGRISARGVYPLAPSLDRVGPMARTVRDVAMLLQALAGRDPAEASTLKAGVPDYLRSIDASVAGMRLGIDRSWVFSNAEPEVAGALENAIDVFRRLGVKIQEVTLPDVLRAMDDWMTILVYEGAASNRPFVTKYGDRVGERVRSLVDEGRSILKQKYDDALASQARFTTEVAKAFLPIDGLLLPTMPAAGLSMDTYRMMASNHADSLSNNSKKTDAFKMLAQFTVPFSVSGNPVVSVSMGMTSFGIPLGMMIAGPHLSEAKLLQLAYNFEQVTPWHNRHPNLM